MIKKTLVIFLLGSISYAAALLTFMPASFVIGYLRSWITESGLPVEISAEQGTLWQGSAQISHVFFAGRVDWDLKPWRIPFGNQALDLVLESKQIRMTGNAGYGDGAMQVASELSLNLSALKPLLSKHRIDIGGELTVSNLQMALNLRKMWPDRLSGKASWPGGPVEYPIGLKLNSAMMPPLTGMISQQQTNIGLFVTDGESQRNVMHFSLAPGGTVEIHVRKHLLDIAQAPWSRKGSPDDVVFKLKQKLWNI